jgi:hypothetical protein
MGLLVRLRAGDSNIITGQALVAALKKASRMSVAPTYRKPTKATRKGEYKLLRPRRGEGEY